MAILTISEFVQMVTAGGGAQAGATPPAVEQAIPIGAGSVVSNAFGPTTRFIRLNCDVPCCLGFALPGATPVAVVGFHRLGPNESGYYGASPGAKVAAIASPT